MVSDSTLQLSFKKLRLVDFWFSSKDEFPNYLKRHLRYSCFPITYLGEAKFSLYTSTKTT